MLYIRVKRIDLGGWGALLRVCRCRTNAAMNGMFDFDKETAAAILTTGEGVVDGIRYIMGHTLPAEEMADATEPFFMNIEKADGTVTQLLVEPHGMPSR